MVKRLFAVPAACVLALSLSSTMAQAELVPPEPDLSEILNSRNGEQWAIALGKALFWDMQVGSDGMACASCHFSAGADSRVVNQLNPNIDNEFGAIEASGSHSLGTTASGAVSGPNYELVAEDFPFRQLANENDRNSTILIVTNDVVSSAGSYDAEFKKVRKGKLDDKCGPASNDIFHAGGYAARMVEPRNTPTTINAAFNHRNFWDGRADNTFNGVSPFGPRDTVNDPTARVLVLGNYGRAKLAKLSVENASLASQAVGPPLSNFEMSCNNRAFRDLGRKLLATKTRPLGYQEVHKNDSVFRKGPLGNLRHYSKKGLRYSYMNLVRRAFDRKYWIAGGRYEIESDGTLQLTQKGFTQMEMNFPMFFGIAVMMYERTLISDQSAFDSCAPDTSDSNNPFCTGQPTMTALELEGLVEFNNSSCVFCHAAPLFSSASFQEGEEFVPIARAPNATAGPPGPAVAALHDTGFFNLGTRPVGEDIGGGATDPHGDSLSMARTFLDEVLGLPVSDPTGVVDPCDTDIALIIPPAGPNAGSFIDATFDGCSPNGTGAIDISEPDNFRLMVDGQVKTPTLRNVALTPPYFHYGGYSDLDQVMDFYDRGGSRRDRTNGGDDSGTGVFGEGLLPVPDTADAGTNTPGLMAPLGLGQDGKDAIVAFMKTLTDPRVQCDMAPFDHPELILNHGHWEEDLDGDGKADDVRVRIPAVGKGGFQADGNGHMCLPNDGDLLNVDLRNRLEPLD